MFPAEGKSSRRITFSDKSLSSSGLTSQPARGDDTQPRSRHRGFLKPEQSIEAHMMNVFLSIDQALWRQVCGGAQGGGRPPNYTLLVAINVPVSDPVLLREDITPIVCNEALGPGSNGRIILLDASSSSLKSDPVPHDPRARHVFLISMKEWMKMIRSMLRHTSSSQLLNLLCFFHLSRSSNISF